MRRLTAALLALLLGFLLGRTLGAHDDSPMDPPHHEAPNTRAPSATEATPVWILTPQQNSSAAAATVAQDLPQEPPAGLRLTESLEALRQRAEAGDIDAALRLAREQQVCLHALATMPYLPAQATKALGLEALRCLHRAHCTDLRVGELNPIEALGLAALAGDADAAVAYAGAPLQMLGNVTDPTTTLQQWEQRAPALLDTALQAGHPLALALLAEATTGGDRAPALAALLPADPARGVALLWAFRRIPGAEPWYPGLRTVEDWARLVEDLGLAPESLPALMAEGDRVYQGQFAGIRDFNAELRRYQSRIKPLGSSVWNSLQQLSPACHAELRAHPELREIEDRPTPIGAPW